MPETGRVLSFRSRRVPDAVNSGKADELARAYLAVAPDAREPELVRSVLGDPDALMALTSALRSLANSSPSRVESEASAAFSKMVAASDRIGFLDEREFFLGEMALLAGGATRLLGRRQETELWLDRAEASYRHVLNAEPQLARTAYVRMALRYDMRRYDEVLELLPSVSLTFAKLSMPADLAKCHFLEAMCLKDLGRIDQAEACFSRITTGEEFGREGAWVGAALVHLGSLKSDRGNLPDALASYARAKPLLEASNQRTTLADLKFMVADTLRQSGNTDAAFDAYREAIQDHLDLGMVARTAYLRVVLAEALLEAGRAREAEWELLTALPTIDGVGMAAEAVLAVGLLLESVRQRKTDPATLGRVRDLLRSQS